VGIKNKSIKITIRVSEKVREEFQDSTWKNGETMTSVLKAFIKSYVNATKKARGEEGYL